MPVGHHDADGLVLDALDMPTWPGGRAGVGDRTGLIHHNARSGQAVPGQRDKGHDAPDEPPR
jgi:hypothetical protein